MMVVAEAQFYFLAQLIEILSQKEVSGALLVKVGVPVKFLEQGFYEGLLCGLVRVDC